MTLRDKVVRQFVRPTGLLGRGAGWIMGHRDSNVRRNRWAVDRLDLRPTDRVLEIGFGPGVAIEALAQVLPAGHVHGIDHSELMVRAATKRNARAVQSGRVTLARGSVDALPVCDEPFDAILAVNNAGFWPDPPTRLKELRSLLRDGGRIALATQPRCKGADAETSRATAREFERLLAGAGYTDIRVDVLDLDPPAVCVIAVNPPSV